MCKVSNLFCFSQSPKMMIYHVISSSFLLFRHPCIYSSDIEIIDQRNFCSPCIFITVFTLVSGKKLRVIKKASFDDTLITWPNQLLCPLKETM